MPHIMVLVGQSGSGKSSLARALAHQTNCIAVDTDELLCRRFSTTSIPELLKTMPATEFIDNEGTVFLEAVRRAESLGQAAVIATGGSIVHSVSAWHWLSVIAPTLPHCRVVWLSVSKAHLDTRYEQQGFTTESRGVVCPEHIPVHGLFDERDRLYASVADVSVHTANRRFNGDIDGTAAMLAGLIGSSLSENYVPS